MTAPATSLAPLQTDRYHGLDALRAGAMLLGILLHGVMSFIEPPVPIWPAVDRARSDLIGAFVLAVHAFRLQVFFVMAGFFYVSKMVSRRAATRSARSIGRPVISM